MITEFQLLTRTAMPEDRQKLANLIHFEVYVHRHLDWRSPLDWIGEQPYLISEQAGSVVAALACPPEPRNVAWIRMFAAATGISKDRAWKTLWPEALRYLAPISELEVIAAIPLQTWFQTLLESVGFVDVNRVVMLNWERNKVHPVRLLPPLSIRPMTLDDLSTVTDIDEASFKPMWQNSKTSLELAFRQAAIATVMEDDGVLIAYQISTATPLGGHLARLAVHPSRQRHGVGMTLVQDLLSQFERRGAQNVTVNTQRDNHSSLALYQKMGFRMTGEEYPIYQYELQA